MESVMAAVDNLILARDHIAANLAAETLNPKPSYSIDGESVDWTSWAKIQQDRIQQLNTIINSMQPYFVVTRQSL
jgi:hypothetical protein